MLVIKFYGFGWKGQEEWTPHKLVFLGQIRFQILLALSILLVTSGAALISRYGFPSNDIPTSQRSWMWTSILLVPVVEELVFRRGIGTFFRKNFGLFWGSYFSVFVFTFIHSMPTLERLLSGEVGLPLGVILLGIVCEFLYISSGGCILGCILFHMACNATPALFILIDERWLDWLNAIYLG